MGVTTWLDRITDESNLWLSAAKAEEAKDYESASIQYLEDAGECVKRGWKVRGALSCFCAAECIDAMGARAEAKQLYLEAGRLYSSIADHGATGSIREALWALQRAHACYVLADRLKDAEAIHQAYRLLARRANPFSGGSSWLEMPKVEPRPESGASQGNSVPLNAGVERAVDKFLSVTGGAPAAEDESPRLRRTGGMADAQESFVSQLG